MTADRTPTKDRRKGGASRRLTWPALLLSLVVVIAACGNDAPEATAAEAAATGAPVATAVTTDATVQPGDEPTETDSAGAGSDEVTNTLDDLASDTGSASVTIGDTTYEFSLAGTATVGSTTYVGLCRGIFGMIQGSGFATDGRDITVDMEVPPVDWETFTDGRFDPPAISVEDNEADASWVADVSTYAERGSGVGEYEQEGETASGSATFINEWDPESEPVEGTFQIDCAS